MIENVFVIMMFMNQNNAAIITPHSFDKRFDDFAICEIELEKIKELRPDISASCVSFSTFNHEKREI